MIEKTVSFKTTDGAIHATVELAQRHELAKFLEESGILAVGAGAGAGEVLAAGLIEQKDRIVDILTMKASSKPKARKVNGGTKVRKPKVADTGVPGV